MRMAKDDRNAAILVVLTLVGMALGFEGVFRASTLGFGLLFAGILLSRGEASRWAPDLGSTAGRLLLFPLAFALAVSTASLRGTGVDLAYIGITLLFAAVLVGIASSVRPVSGWVAWLVLADAALALASNGISATGWTPYPSALACFGLSVLVALGCAVRGVSHRLVTPEPAGTPAVGTGQ